ncbi:MAG: hypothetical protein HQK75_15540 [Candidatus Magnetomorum sp.]|nr:hypothetical protein [Candidatus Magnetomorum sp.]
MLKCVQKISTYRDKLLFFVFVLSLSFNYCISVLHASSSFDSDDTLFDQEETTLFESEASSWIEDDVLRNQEKENPSLFQRIFLKDSRFTLGHEFSFGLNLKPDAITNNTYIRQELQTLLHDTLFLQCDARLRVMFENDHRAEAQKKDLLTESSLRELYLQLGFENFSIKLGKQIVIWGKADTGIITDVVSPRDTSDFIFIRLEDSRFGQTMLSSTVYTDFGRYFFFIAPKPLTDKEPDEGTRYYIPFQGLFIMEEIKPENADIEYGSRWEKTFGKTDVSLMTGRFFSNTGIYQFSGIDFFSRKPRLQKKYHAYEMIGMAASHVKDSFLFKIEAAYKRNYSLQGLNFSDWVFPEQKNLMDVSVGTEYNANDRYQVSVELAHRHINGNMKGLPFDKKNSTTLYCIITKNFFNQTVNTEYLFYYHIQESNAFHQLRLTRDVTDNFQIITSFAFFDSQDDQSLLWFFKDEHRLTVDINYYF